jgi:hypothetical protein
LRASDLLSAGFPSQFLNLAGERLFQMFRPVVSMMDELHIAVPIYKHYRGERVHAQRLRGRSRIEGDGKIQVALGESPLAHLNGFTLPAGIHGKEDNFRIVLKPRIYML